MKLLGSKMDLSDGNYFNLEYWLAVYNKLEGEFVDISLPHEPRQQVGVWIIERADLVLKPENLEEIFGNNYDFVKNLIIKVLLLTIDKYPDLFFLHFYNTLGGFSYSGLLNISDPEIFKMWWHLSKKYKTSSINSNLAISQLADLLLGDKHLSNKLEVLISGNADGKYDSLSLDQFIYELEKKFTLNGYDDPTIKIFFELGILNEDPISYKRAILDENIIKAGFLFKKLCRLRDEVDSSKLITKYFKKYKYTKCFKELSKLRDKINNTETLRLYPN